MRCNLCSKLAVGLVVFAVASMAGSTRASAQVWTPLYNFAATSAGAPYGGVIFDASGNLYGTLTAFSNGAVFELTPHSDGWGETLLYTFTGGTDGSDPQAGLVIDGAGNLYGTTMQGGAYGFGTVFELSPISGGGWSESILHSFGNGTDGQSPQASLIRDSKGNLYGTAPNGGNFGKGVVFELSPKTGGAWTEKLLHQFGNASDGANPNGTLILDAAGNLYGTATRGGSYAAGTVFELLHGTHGMWSEKTLHVFNLPAGGQAPANGLVFDSHGNLYGTAGAGSAGAGVVFELVHQASGLYNEKLVHTFLQNGVDGYGPQGLIIDGLGNLYGTTYVGGASGFGTAFELSPTGKRTFSEMILHSYNLYADGDGAYPYGTLVRDSSGNVYGTTLQGGTNENGLIFEITP